jgi:hypothetical protein
MQIGGFFLPKSWEKGQILLKIRGNNLAFIWLKFNQSVPLPSNSQFSNCGYLGVEAILVRRLTKKT